MNARCLLLTIALATFGCAAALAADDELLSSAKLALARGERDRALELAKRAVAADMKNSACYLVLARAHDARREFDEAIAACDQAIRLAPRLIAAYQQRGEDNFRLGEFKASVADFDKVVEAEPARAPYDWQRGIALYYAGQYERGAKQFESHKTVNPEDVENAVWHYLCVAKTSGVAAARKGLIPIQHDSRVPLMTIYALFRGAATPDDVLTAARAGDPDEADLKERLFYAHLYIGLFDEATGDSGEARKHIRLAAEKFADDGYMGDVARVHAALLKSAK